MPRITLVAPPVEEGLNRRRIGMATISSELAGQIEDGREKFKLRIGTHIIQVDVVRLRAQTWLAEIRSERDRQLVKTLSGEWTSQ